MTVNPDRKRSDELPSLWDDRMPILGAVGLAALAHGQAGLAAVPGASADARAAGPASGGPDLQDGAEDGLGLESGLESGTGAGSGGQTAGAMADAAAVTAGTGADTGPAASFAPKPDTADTADTGGGNRGPTRAHDGHDHDDGPTIRPPGEGASQAKIDAYVAAVKAQPEDHAHSDDPGKAAEHEAVMELVPRSEATHIAVSDGDWFDPGTWYNGQIPGEGAKVLIPEGIHVHYDDVSDARLFTVRVDGELHFDSHTDSRMVFDTMVVSPTGNLIIGSESDPVDADVTVELVVANNGAINTDWDPMLLSRGVISHGEVSIHGAEKDSHEKVIRDPMAGDRALQFDEVPEGWQVGDQVVVAGTRFDGWKWDNATKTVRLHENEDEVRTIVAIRDDGRIILDRPLEFDHDTPRSDLKTSVANMTRNVVISTENGSDAEIYERGHVMFMHSDDVDVRYAQFQDLGRTDKSVASFAFADIDNPQFDSNVQGRYALHLHRTGTGDPDNPVMVEGNAVWGSPGWGFVQHDSNAVLNNNASFDTFGAGFVAETGNETGHWNDNIAIYAPGVGWGLAKNLNQIGADVFDVGRSGDGFWFQGRMVGATNNIAASVNHGFVYFHRDGNDTMKPFDAAVFDYPDVFYGNPSVYADHAPILSFQGNEAFAANTGLEVVKHGAFQGHDVWTRIDDFLAWSVRNGVSLEYTTNYLLTNLDLIAKDPTQFSDPGSGVVLGTATAQIVILNSKIEGFTGGVKLDNIFNHLGITPDRTHYFVVDTVITRTQTDFLGYDPRYNITITDRAGLTELPTDLQLDPLVFADRKVVITGWKNDGLGRIDFPGAPQKMVVVEEDVKRVLEKGGYWVTTDGDAYFLLDIYYTDRLTGEIYFEKVPVALSAATVAMFGQSWGEYQEVELNGVKDIPTEDIKYRVLGDKVERIVLGSDAGERIAGVDISDVIFGKSGADVLLGRLGNDYLMGDSGDDRLVGGSGADGLFGGDGRDTLIGGKDNDGLAGGSGADVFVFSGRDFGTDTVKDFDGDRIRITADGEAATQHQLTAALSQQGGNVVYDHLGDGRNVIIFLDTTLAELPFALFDLG
jgi:hypothetical protein